MGQVPALVNVADLIIETKIPESSRKCGYIINFLVFNQFFQNY